MAACASRMSFKIKSECDFSFNLHSFKISGLNCLVVAKLLTDCWCCRWFYGFFLGESRTFPSFFIHSCTDEQSGHDGVCDGVEGSLFLPEQYPLESGEEPSGHCCCDGCEGLFLFEGGGLLLEG
jgi:hypothetical protein